MKANVRNLLGVSIIIVVFFLMIALYLFTEPAQIKQDNTIIQKPSEENKQSEEIVLNNKIAEMQIQVQDKIKEGIELKSLIDIKDTELKNKDIELINKDVELRNKEIELKNKDIEKQKLKEEIAILEKEKEKAEKIIVNFRTQGA